MGSEGLQHFSDTVDPSKAKDQDMAAFQGVLLLADFGAGPALRCQGAVGNKESTAYSQQSTDGSFGD